MRALSIDARYRVVKNLVRNGTFDLNISSGWTGYTGTTVATTSAEKHRGTYAISAGVTAAGHGIAGLVTGSPDQQATGPAGREYAVAWVKAPAGMNMTMSLAEYGPTSPYPAFGAPATTAFTGTGAWQEVKVSRVKSTAENIQRVQIQTTTAAAFTFYVDDICQYAASGADLSSLGVLDGDSPGWVWEGTPNRSTSRGLVFVP